ncbi:MAG TPA: GNAT family N-acetyltransferase [Mucilaginibacter sp.]
MTISKATIEDVPALHELVNRAYRGEESLRGWASEANILDGARIDTDTLTEYINDKDITILKYTSDAGEIEACVYLEAQGEKLYLGMLSVLPHLQDKGLGRRLLQEAELFAKNMNKPVITMTVITTRHQLIDWYVRRGYQRTGKRLPFHAETKFGIPKVPIELEVLEKLVDEIE